MKSCKFTTTLGVEISVDCDEICEDLPEDSLTAKSDGHTVRVFTRASLLCWEEIAKTTELVVSAENRRDRRPANSRVATVEN